MPGAMTSAIALWIFSSLHKQSWQNIQVIRVRHCDHWFQELKIDTWPSERPWDLLPSLEASSCLCLYCHSWIKFFRAWSVWLTCSHSSCLLYIPLSLSLSCPGAQLIIPEGRDKLVPSVCFWVWGLRETTLPIGPPLGQKVSEGLHWTFIHQVVSEGLHRVAASLGSEWRPTQRPPQCHPHYETDSRKVEGVARLWDKH